MAMENYCSDSGVSKKRAKELLTSEEVEWLKIAVKSFSKTKSMETFCSNLFKIIYSSSSTVDHDILAKVRQCLPKNQRSKFTRYCNELLKTEALRGQRRDLARNGNIGEANEFKRGRGLENFAPNFQCSPAKRKKQDKLRPLKNKIEKKESKIDRASADCVKDRKQSKTLKAERKKLDSLSRSGNKIIVLKRNSLKQGFGFRIRGGNSREPSITVAEVKQGSIAGQQGLNYRDKIVSVNEKRCGKNGMNMNELIRKIKASKVLQIRITPVQSFCEDVRRAEDVGEANGRERRKQEDELLSTVTVYPGEDGWLGCCIRGGTDYACEVHVISVDAGSPAERAGIKPGDMIVKINGLSIKDLTHVQVVRLVITSGLSVQISLMCGRKQRSSGQQATNVQPTQLRTYCTRPRDATPPQSPSFKQFRPLGYPQRNHGVTESPSQLPLDVLSLDCLPPPPYTPEVPSRHRVLARGKVEPVTPVRCPEELQQTHCNQEVQDTIFQEEEQSSSLGQQQQPHGTHCSQDSQHARCNSDEGKPEQQQLQSSASVQKPMVTREIIDCEDINTDDADMFQDVGLMGQHHDSHSSIVQQRNKPETVIEETQYNTSPSSSSQSTARSNGRKCLLSHIQQFNQANLRSLGDCPQINSSKDMSYSSDDCLPPATNQLSPPQENSRECFLSQIRQFNKEKLRKLSGCPGQTIPCQLQGNPSTNEGLPEDVLLSVESEEDSMQVNDVQECVDADSLFAALAQVMHSRAKVLQDTLSSIGEYDSDSSEGEWEL